MKAHNPSIERTASLRINGRHASLQQLWRPEMSLSSSKVGRPSATYSLRVDRSALVAALAEGYQGCVQELKADDAITGTTDVFGQADYPPLEALFGVPDLAAKVLSTYFHEELFSAVLPPVTGDMSGTWAIDTIADVAIDGEHVVIHGVCYGF